jgi:hypothetical protein
VVDAAILIAAVRGRSSGAILAAARAAALVTTDRIVAEARRRIELGLKRPELNPILDGLIAEMTVVPVAALSALLPQAETALRDAVASRNGSSADAHALALAWRDADVWSTDRGLRGDRGRELVDAQSDPRARRRREGRRLNLSRRRKHSRPRDGRCECKTGRPLTIRIHHQGGQGQPMPTKRVSTSSSTSCSFLALGGKKIRQISSPSGRPARPSAVLMPQGAICRRQRASKDEFSGGAGRATRRSGPAIRPPYWPLRGGFTKLRAGALRAFRRAEAGIMADL